MFLVMATGAMANTAGIVVAHGDGNTIARAVGFNEDSISGTELLRRSGLNNSIEQGSAGEAVYMIDGEGDPTGWVTKGGKTYYWGFYTFAGGKWQYSPVGAGAAIAKDGAVHLWIWQYYNQEIAFPAVSIPEMDFMLASANAQKTPPIDPAGSLPTSTAKKPADTSTGFGWAYAVFLGLLLVLAVILIDRIRPRYRRRK